MKAFNKTVGVVIPFYNGSAYIERALKSVLRQSVNATEIVIVNDGSSDHERKILDDLSIQYKGKFRIIDQENQGQGGARNAGVKNLKSEYVCFLDQDDYFLVDHIQDLLNAITVGTIDLGYVYGDLSVMDELGRVLFIDFIKGKAKHPKESIIELLCQDMYVLPSASMIKVDAFQSVGGFDPQFMGYEDDDLFMRLFLAGFKNEFLQKPVTMWCIRAGSTSYNIRMKRSRYKYFLKLTETFKDEPALGRFYFRDFIAPRFFWTFASDVLTEQRFPTENKTETISFLIGFKRLVKSQTSISSIEKFKVNFIVLLITKSPRFLLILLIHLKGVYRKSQR